MAEIGEKKLSYESIANKRLTWVDLQKPTHENMKVLEKSYLFHELDIEDCLSKIQIPKIDRHEDYIFILVHFPIWYFKRQRWMNWNSLSNCFLLI
jgi:Mg2+ and Co2+ transporter CorA